MKTRRLFDGLNWKRVKFFYRFTVYLT